MFDVCTLVPILNWQLVHDVFVKLREIAVYGILGHYCLTSILVTRQIPRTRHGVFTVDIRDGTIVHDAQVHVRGMAGRAQRSCFFLRFPGRKFAVHHVLTNKYTEYLVKTSCFT